MLPSFTLTYANPMIGLKRRTFF